MNANQEVIVRSHQSHGKDVFHTDPDCRYVGRMKQQKTVELRKVFGDIRECLNCSGEFTTPKAGRKTPEGNCPHCGGNLTDGHCSWCENYEEVMGLHA